MIVHTIRRLSASVLTICACTAAAQPSLAASPAENLATRIAATAAFDPVSQTRSPRDARESVSAQAVEYYKTAFNVPTETATERLATQGQVPNLKQLVERRIGKAAGTVWFDNTTGDWRVGVLTARAVTPAEQLLKSVGLGAHSRVDVVGVSDSDLERQADIVASRFGDVARGHGLTIGVAAGKLNVQVGESTPSATVEAIRDFSASADSKRVAVTVSRAPDESLRPAPRTTCTAFSTWNAYCTDIVAGIHIALGGNGQSECTAAFLGYLPSNPATPRLLTAGHCIRSIGSTAWSCKAFVGTCPVMGIQTAGYSRGSIGDAGLIRLDAFPNTWLATPGYANWSNSAVSIVHTWEGSNSPVGQVVCKNGARTGSTCGTVLESYASFTESGTGQWKSGMVRTNACILSGDSGSPVTQAAYEAAAGIATHGGCTAGNPAMFYEPVSRAMANFGFQVLVA